MNDMDIVNSLVTDEFLISELADVTGLGEDKVIEKLAHEIYGCYPKTFCAARFGCIACDCYDICTMLEVRK